MVKFLVLILTVCYIGYSSCSGIVTKECTSDKVDVWEFRPHPTDCNLYIVCMNNVGVVLECPDGLYFDPETELCDLPDNTDCVSVTESPPTTEEPPTDPPGCNLLCVLQSSQWGGEVADPENCDRFVNCADNCRATAFTCPGNLHFNHLLSVCDLSERSECLLEVCVDRPIGTLTSLNSCGHFFLCMASQATLMSCTPNSVFHPVSGCIPGDPSQCEQRLQSQNIPEVPEEVVEKCRFEDNKFIAHPQKCDVFYRCANGYLFGRKCQDGLLFDETLGVCNVDVEVDCAELE